jgi:hypothetical protein
MKVFIIHLYDIFTLAPDLKQIYLGDISQEITSVSLWLQGVITKFHDLDLDKFPQDTICMSVDDGTSVISVIYSSRQCSMPQGKMHNFCIGDYIMVRGNAVLEGLADPSQANDGSKVASLKRRFKHVSIEADCVIYLGADANLESLWNLEVIMYRNVKM